MVFEKYNGTDTKFTVPAYRDGTPVTEIAPKAFLSCKTIRKLIIPDTVTHIGDWAFAHMKNLEELVIPFHRISYGKKVFLDCGHLKKIEVSGRSGDKEGIAYFLASVITILKKDILWSPERAEDKRWQGGWMKAYDEAVEEYLTAPDEEGFEPVFIGWFNDEDADVQRPRYLEQKQKDKIRLVLQRLLYPEFLSADRKAVLQAYLADHMPDGRCREEHTWVADMICDERMEYHNDVRYLKILEESGCLNSNNIKILLEALSDSNPEMAAYLLRLSGRGSENGDFFQSLEL